VRYRTIWQGAVAFDAVGASAEAGGRVGGVGVVCVCACAYVCIRCAQAGGLQLGKLSMKLR